jgi:outer membrane murein-binding lipoprotein Lpp
MPKAKEPEFSSRDFGALEGNVGVLRQLSFAVIGLLSLIVAGGVALMVQIGGVNSKVDLLRKDVETTTDKLDKLASDLGDIRQGQMRTSETLARIDSRLAPQQAPSPQIALSSGDLRTIREFIRFSPSAATLKAPLSIGMILENPKLFDFPDRLLEKIPQLKATKYAIDDKGQVIVVDAQNRVVAIA